ncbi:MAG: hypothetical protein AB7K09_20060 [Planctomycetota bacterium]
MKLRTPIVLLLFVVGLVAGSAWVVMQVLAPPVPPHDSTVASAPAPDAAVPTPGRDDDDAAGIAPGSDADTDASGSVESPTDATTTDAPAVEQPGPTATDAGDATPAAPAGMSAADFAAFKSTIAALLATDPQQAMAALLKALADGRITPEQLLALYEQLLDDEDLGALVKVNLALTLLDWPQKKVPLPPSIIEAVRSRILPSLRELWSDDTPDALRDQIRRVQLLGLVGTPEAAVFAGEVFAGTEEPEVQAATINALGQMRSHDANNELVNILVGDKAAKWRDLTYHTLLGSMDEATMTQLQAILQSPESTPAELVAAFDLISSMINRQKGGRVAGQVDPALAEAVPQLFALYGQTEDVNVRRMVLSALGEIAGLDSWTALNDILNGEEANLYLLDAAALNLSIGSGPAHEMLQNVLNSSNARLEARLTAWKYLGSAQVGALLQAIGRDPENVALRDQLDSLLGPARDLAHLAFSGGTPEQQVLAVQNLAGIPDSHVINSFIDGLAGDPDARVAIAVSNALVNRYANQPNVKDVLGTTVYQAVERAVTSGQLNDNERINGLGLLGRVNGRNAAPLFASIADTPGNNARVRRMAVAQLIRSKADGYGDMLLRLAQNDPDAEIRRLATLATQQPTGTD